MFSTGLCKEGVAWVDGSDAEAHSFIECSNKVRTTNRRQHHPRLVCCVADWV